MQFMPQDVCKVPICKGLCILNFKNMLFITVDWGDGSEEPSIQ